MIRVTTGFSDGWGAETSVHGNFPHRNEGNVPEAATVELELAMVLGTQYGGDEYCMKPIADLTSSENKMTLHSGP